MTTYVLRDGVLVEKRYAPPKSGVQIMRDTPEYVSPICNEDGRHPLIDGRAARREDLKRNGCREYDPGERRAFEKEVARHREEMAAIARDPSIIFTRG
jgi:hypothetical protein